MTFSTRSNPRIAQSGVALTSLGAVGGPRGTAAGALRVFVEFLTTYNKKETEALENDLRQLDHAQNNSTLAEEKRQRRLSQVKSALTETERVTRGKLNTQLRSDLKQIETLEASRSKTNRVQAAQQRVIFNQAAKSLGLSKEELQLLASRSKLEKEGAVLEARSAQAAQGQTQRTRQQVQLEGQLGKLQAGRAALLPKLGGLAVGAIGGLVGGAILGVGFAAADAAIQQVGEKIQDLIDPSRHARDEIDQLGASVAQLASDKSISFLDAAKIKLKEFGLAADEDTSKILAQFAAQQKANKAIQDYITYLDAIAHPNADQDQAVQKLTDALIAQAEAAGKLKTVKQFAPVNVTQLVSVPIDVADRQYYYNKALEQFKTAAQDATSEAQRLADAQVLQAQAAALAAIQNRALADAINAASAKSTGAIDTQISNLGSGESARTRAIQAQIDRAQNAGGGIGGQLRNLQEERELILLRKRLSVLGANINLEKYSGKFLLEAINAKIAALEKEGQQQQRLNQLQDLQYRMSQTIRRQQGESIKDFVERRAEEQRHQLAEAADLDRQAKIDSLQALQQKVQDEVALADLAEQKKNLLASQGANNRIKSLQKELEASKKADTKALEAKRKALEAKKAAEAKAAKDAIFYASVEANEEIKQALRAANTVEKLAAISGQTRGLIAARSFLQALLESGVLQPGEAKAIQAAIARIGSTLNAIGDQEDRIMSHQLPVAGQGPIKFAKGGIIPLSNARNPFGSNYRFGEQGDEIGVVLSNKVAAALKDGVGGGVGQVGPFNMYGDQSRRDMYEMGKTVEQAVTRALS